MFAQIGPRGSTERVHQKRDRHMWLITYRVSSTDYETNEVKYNDITEILAVSPYEFHKENDDTPWRNNYVCIVYAYKLSEEEIADYVESRN